MIHLDTSFLIRALVRGSPEGKRLARWLRDGVPVGISAVAWAEFLCGPVSGEHAGLVLDMVSACIPLDAAAASRAAALYNQDGRRKGSFTDCLIAAVALEHEAALATANEKDFARFEDLELA